MTNLKPVNLIMLLAMLLTIVRVLLREEIEAICKIKLVFVDFNYPCYS